MAAYRWVYDLCHLQADCQEPGSAPERYARQSSMGYLYIFYIKSISAVLYQCLLGFQSFRSASSQQNKYHSFLSKNQARKMAG